MLHDPQTAFGLIGLGLPCVSRATVRAPTAALRAGEGPWRPLKAYLFLVADCALRSACSAHAIHAAAISINIALSFSDARCAKRRHSAAYCRKRSASLSMTRSTFWVCSNVPSCLGVFPNVPSCKPGTLRTVPVQINFADGTKAAIRRSSRALIWGRRNGEQRNGEA